MFLKKPALGLLALPCLFLAHTSLASTTLTKIYAPYIGFEHGFSSMTLFDDTISKYTPRFFVGFSPLQTDSYKVGLEMGYTLPATYKEGYQSYYIPGEIEFLIKTKKTDLYLTFVKSLSKKTHWFLKPGVEYFQAKYQAGYYENYGEDYYYGENKFPSIYLGAKAGVGYDFSNRLGINLVAGSRFIDLKRNDDNPKKFIFNVNVQYSF